MLLSSAHRAYREAYSANINIKHSHFISSTLSAGEKGRGRCLPLSFVHKAHAIGKRCYCSTSRIQNRSVEPIIICSFIDCGMIVGKWQNKQRNISKSYSAFGKLLKNDLFFTGAKIKHKKLSCFSRDL